MRIQDINKLPKFAKDELIASCGNTFDFNCVGVILVINSFKDNNSGISSYKVKHIFARTGDFRIHKLKTLSEYNLLHQADVVFDMKGHLVKNRYGNIHRILQ